MHIGTNEWRERTGDERIHEPLIERTDAVPQTWTANRVGKGREQIHGGERGAIDRARSR